MSTSVITTRTGLISDLGRTLPVVELQRHRIRVATRLSLCRDWVVCITATQSRPNNFQLRTELLRCQDRREIHARILAVEPLPLASGDAQSGRRPRHAKRCLPRKGPPASKTRRRLVLMNHKGLRATWRFHNSYPLLTSPELSQVRERPRQTPLASFAAGVGSGG